MRVLLVLLLAMVATVFAWVIVEPKLRTPTWMRQNYRGHWLPTAGGVVVFGVVGVAELGLRLGGAEGSEQRLYEFGAALAFAALGLLDDLRGGTAISGYRGHLTALWRGEITTGVVKLLGGGIIGLIIAARHTDGLVGMLVDAGVIALVANLANLLDRGPGRTSKVVLAAGLVLLVSTGFHQDLVAMAVVLGVGFGLLPGDLRERLMLGDTGANALGGALGTGIVVATPPVARVVILVLALAANLASERVSFSEVIRNSGLLRALDDAGRRHKGGVPVAEEVA